MNFEHTLKFSSAEEREQFLKVTLNLLTGLLPLNETVRVRICVDVLPSLALKVTAENDTDKFSVSPEEVNIGDVLRALRIKYGIIQSKIDNALKLGQQYVSKVETGRILKPVKLSRKKAHKLIDLGVDPNDPLFIRFLDFLEE
jgi:hypothetical protein